jgi:adenosylcobinamide kinase / adenosylcobinamide-phosphate guanylyltransferase
MRFRRAARRGDGVKTLVLGGVRSGKSRYAEQVAGQGAASVVMVVTATADDEEMAARIAAHRARRPPQWQVVEEPVALGGAISRATAPGTVVIVDCLTLWLANLLALGDRKVLEGERDALNSAVSEASGTLVLVSNEVGSGIVPANELARRFRDEAGFLHQELARLCDQVVWMVAGLPVVVKAAGRAAGERA